MSAGFNYNANVEVLGHVFDERKRQHVKWGEQNHLSGKWFEILGEEYGEACKAALESDGLKYRAELVHVAAVAVAAIECYDRRRKDGNIWRN